MTTCYIEVDDEITTAIARLRAVTDGEAIIIVPPASRIATSRINFKLLAREGNERRLNVAAVSDDPAVRALAVSAGLPTYDTLAGAEEALASFREQDRRLARRLGREATDPAAAGREATDDVGREGATRVLRAPVVSDASLADEEAPAKTAVLSSAAVVAPADDDAAAAAWPSARRRRRRRRSSVAPLLVLALLGLLVAGVAYGAYAFLPTAAITLRPATTTLAPGAFSVVADPNVAVVDAQEGAVPAETIELPLSVSGTFSASGVEARETRATGSVRFRSENTLNDVPIPAGTLVATGNGIEFVTEDTASVERASFASGPTTVDVTVRAVRGGPRGNVAAGAITELPPELASQLITVRNPEATSGGRRIEESVVTEQDFDSAVAALTGQLDAELTAELVDPASVPRGLTVFPATAQVVDTRPDQPAGSVVGTAMSTFTVTVEATGRVTAVNETLIDEVAATRLRSQLAPGQSLLDDRVVSGRSSGEVLGNRISYEVSPSAVVYSAPDQSALVAQVRGKTIPEAEQILGRYGMVEIVLWPEFVDRLPDQSARISLTIAPPIAAS